MLYWRFHEAQSVVSQPPAIYRFGLFEVDARSGEVRKSGVKVKLQDQPLHVLLKLLERPGIIVSRDELRAALWQGGTFVDFDAGLNTAIRRLRDALGDSADSPTLIETVPRRGYRFVAPVETVALAPADLQERDATSSPGPETSRPSSSSRRSIWLALGVVAALALLVAFVLLSGQTSPVASNPLHFKQITHDGVAKSGPLLSDGSRIYFSELTTAGRVVVQVAATGGEVASVPTVLDNPRLCNISADGSELLVLAGQGEPPLPLWVLPVTGGSPRRIGGILAADAAWCPDPGRLIYAAGHDIFLVGKDGTGSQRLLEVEGFPTGLSWSPDGERLRFHVWDPAPASLALWEVVADGTGLHQVLPASSGLASSSSGVWSPATRTFFFQAATDNRTDVWAMPAGRRWLPWESAGPVRLTSGPLSFSAPAVNPGDPRELFVLGTAPRAELVRFDSSTGRFLPYLAGISAEGVDFSKDGQWIAFTAYPDGALWRSRIDGTERRQLTFSPLRAFLPRWSPDGRSIAFVDISNEPWTIRVISSTGTGLTEVSPTGEGASDPTWSPAGDRLAFGGVDLTHADDPSKFVIRVLDLESGRVVRSNTLPGSNGLFSPRWSPDGRHMTAINAASELVVLDLAGQNPAFTLRGFRAGFPSWSRGGDSIYFQDRTNTEVPGRILRLRLANRAVETVAELERIGRLPLGTFASWSGLAPDDAPLLSRDISVQEVYSVHW